MTLLDVYVVTAVSAMLLYQCRVHAYPLERSPRYTINDLSHAITSIRRCFELHHVRSRHIDDVIPLVGDTDDDSDFGVVLDDAYTETAALLAQCRPEGGVCDPAACDVQLESFLASQKRKVSRGWQQILKKMRCRHKTFYSSLRNDAGSSTAEHGRQTAVNEIALSDATILLDARQCLEKPDEIHEADKPLYRKIGCGITKQCTILGKAVIWRKKMPGPNHPAPHCTAAKCNKQKCKAELQRLDIKEHPSMQFLLRLLPTLDDVVRDSSN